MNPAKEGSAKPTNDYITDLSSSFKTDPAKTALVVVDMQYATGSRKAGLGKRLTEEGKIDKLAGERFDRVENVVVPNLQRVLAFFRENGLRVIYVTYGSRWRITATLPRIWRTSFGRPTTARGSLSTRSLRKSSLVKENR